MGCLRNLEAISCKRGEGPQGHNFKFILDILELMIKSKKKVSGVFKGSFETYTRYYVNFQKFRGHKLQKKGHEAIF